MRSKATQRCLYEVLGVEQEADEDVIKKAYRKMALTWHPGGQAGTMVSKVAVGRMCAVPLAQGRKQVCEAAYLDQGA